MVTKSLKDTKTFLEQTFYDQNFSANAGLPSIKDQKNHLELSAHQTLINDLLKSQKDQQYQTCDGNS